MKKIKTDESATVKLTETRVRGVAVRTAVRAGKQISNVKYN